MKNIIIIAVMLLCYNSLLPAQNFHVGSNLILGAGWENVKFGGGLELVAGYTITEDMELRVDGGFFNSELDAKNIYLTENTYVLFFTEGGLIYTLLSNSTAAFYGGGGIGFYFPQKSQSGNRKYDSNIFSKTDFENSLGFFMLTGVRFTPQKFFSLNFELKFLSLNTKHSVYNAEPGNNNTFTVKTDLSTLTGKFGLVLNF